MGKKNKVKRNLFAKDYSDISSDDQMRMMTLDPVALVKMLSKKSNDEEDEYEPDDTDDEPIESFATSVLSKRSPSEVQGRVSALSHSDISVGRDDSIPEGRIIPHIQGLSNDVLRSVGINSPLYDGDDIDVVEGLKPVIKPQIKVAMVNPGTITNEIVEDHVVAVGTTEDKHDAVEVEVERVTKESIEIRSINNSNDDQYDENEPEFDQPSSLETEFEMITVDVRNASFVIHDPWNDWKSHTINCYGLNSARTNYQSSTYQSIREFAKYACALIAGPALVVKPGNEYIQRFINNVVDFDNERVIVLSKTYDHPNKDGEQPKALLFYIMNESDITALNDVISSFELPENSLALDFMYGLLKKSIDRHENPWFSTSFMDSYIDIAESSSEDIEFVVDLIMSSDVNVQLGNSNFAEFERKHVSKIEDLIRSINEIVNVMRPIMEKSVEDDESIMIIPDDFNATGVKVIQEDIKDDDSINIEDVGDDDDVDIDTEQTDIPDQFNGLAVKIAKAMGNDKPNLVVPSIN